jgi:hypothetical protein
MGITNTRLNLENSVARFKGEREAKIAEIAKIEAGVEALPELRERIAKLDILIASAETIVRENNPEWSSEQVQPRRITDRDSTIPFGLLGRTALEVMRDAPLEGWPARHIASEVLRKLGHDPDDRVNLDKRANSLSAYLKANEGDLVESDGAQYYKKWRLIR